MQTSFFGLLVSVVGFAVACGGATEVSSDSPDAGASDGGAVLGTDAAPDATSASDASGAAGAGGAESAEARPPVTLPDGGVTGDDLCELLCQRRNECDPTIRVDGCAYTCAMSLGPARDSLNPDYGRILAQCYLDADCASLADERAFGGLADECRAAAIAATSTTAAGEALCQELSDARTACGEVQDKELCLERSKTITDEALEKARQCAKLGCEEIGQCIRETLGRGLGRPTERLDAGSEEAGSDAAAIDAGNACADGGCDDAGGEDASGLEAAAD